MSVDAEFIQQADLWIRSGQVSRVARELKALKALKKPEKLPRELRVGLARLARRVVLPEIGIGLLRPYVRPAPRSPARATDAEKAEYAASLTRIGATEEALKLLAQVDVARAPEALLFLAFIHISRWEYAEAVPLLERYVVSKDIDDYQRLVGNTNLATAYFCSGDVDRSRELAREVLAETSDRKLTLLHGGLCELGAEAAIERGDWSEAASFLDRAARDIADPGAIQELFVRKWRAILATKIEKGSPRSIRQLDSIRAEAESRRHWETVRDCDLQRAIATRDRKLLLRVYFGTPYPSFRAKILAEYRDPVTRPDSYVWKEPGRAVRSLDLVSPEALGLKGGQLLHRALLVLSSDFYRPVRLAAIHGRLFPDRHFHPEATPNQMHQLLSRVRGWMSEEGFASGLLESGGGYRIRLAKGEAIVVPGESGGSGCATESRVRILQAKFGLAEFRASEAGRVLGLTPRTLARLLGDETLRRRLEVRGGGRSTRYRFRG